MMTAATLLNGAIFPMSYSTPANGPVVSASPRRVTSLDVQRRAAAAARIFDVMATVVLVVGLLLVIVQVVGGGAFLVGLGDSDSLDASGLSTSLLVGGLLASVVATVIGTAVCWATITLATAVAGYIAQRSPESLG